MKTVCFQLFTLTFCPHDQRPESSFIPISSYATYFCLFQPLFPASFAGILSFFMLKLTHEENVGCVTDAVLKRRQHSSLEPSVCTWILSQSPQDHFRFPFAATASTLPPYISFFCHFIHIAYSFLYFCVYIPIVASLGAYDSFSDGDIIAPSLIPCFSQEGQNLRDG